MKPQLPTLLPGLLSIVLTLQVLPAQPAPEAPDSAPAESSPESTPLLPTGLRSWKSSDGKTIKADLLEVDHAKQTVRLKMENGKTMANVPFSRFSAEDRKFIASCRVQVRKDESGITGVSGNDPDMTKAQAEARKTFPAAYKEIEKDSSRVIPAYTMVFVKARFSDQPEKGDDADDIEHMWIGDFQFDGKEITGILMSRPAKVKSVREGQTVTIPLSRLSDWSYAVEGKVHGAYTEKLLHSRMTAEEKKAHNEATGMDWDAQ